MNINFSPAAPNAVWVTDITHIWTISGFVYLSTVMDLFSRIVVGWHLSDSLSTEGVFEAKPARKFIRSYSQKGNPWGNAVIESFHALIKREWLNRFVIRHISHAHELIFEYIEAFYNTTRIHCRCEMKPK